MGTIPAETGAMGQGAFGAPVPVLARSADLADVPDPAEALANLGALPGWFTSRVLAGNAASITLPSPGAFPAGFSLLRLIVTGASAAAAEGDRWLVTVNGDTGGNYDVQDLHGTDVTAAAAVKNGNAGWTLATSTPGDLPGASATAGVAGILEIHIPAYAGTTFQKAGTWRSGYSDAATSASDQWASAAIIAWRSAAAITSVTVATESGSDLVAGTAAYLWLS